MLTAEEITKYTLWKTQLRVLIRSCERLHLYYTLELAKSLMLYADRQVAKAQAHDLVAIGQLMVKARARRQARVLVSFQIEMRRLRCAST